MSVFRPSNINKRLVGTATTTTVGGSPGNGGQLGPKKTPYIVGPFISLGEVCQFGCCGGVFKTNESICGRRQDCQCALLNLGGFLICKQAPNLKWVVSPISAEVSRTWYCRVDANIRSQQVSGCTGWFIPTLSNLQNPGYLCRSFWGPSPCYSSTGVWSDDEFYSHYGCVTCFNDSTSTFYPKTNIACARAFRCVSY